MRERTGLVIGNMTVIHKPEDLENPFTVEVDGGEMRIESAPLDYEDFENLIRWFRWQKKVMRETHKNV